MKRLISTYCRSDHLIQMTVAQLNPGDYDSWWLFKGITLAASLRRGLERVNSDQGSGAQKKWRPIVIPRTNATEEKLFNSARGYDQSGIFPNEMAASTDVPEINSKPPAMNSNGGDSAAIGVSTSAMSSSPIGNFLGTVSGYDQTYSRSIFQSTLRIVRAFQNPLMKDMNPSHLDCVQCHITDGTQFWMNEKMPGYDREMFTDTLFVNPKPAWYNLTNKTATPRSSKINRAFGYWQQYPAISQRVIHESTLVADRLNQHD